MGPSTKW